MHSNREQNFKDLSSAFKMLAEAPKPPPTQKQKGIAALIAALGGNTPENRATVSAILDIADGAAEEAVAKSLGSKLPR
jgi:hypothetical protein